MSSETNNSPVFYDPEGKRYGRVRIVWLTFAVLITCLIIIFIVSVLFNPVLPILNLKPISSLPRVSDINIKPDSPVPNRISQKSRRIAAALRDEPAKSQLIPSRRPAQINILPQMAPRGARPMPGISSNAKPISAGFYVNWDDSSYQSLKRNLDRLDWVIPEWVRLQNGSDPVVREIDPRAVDLISRQKPGLPIIPMIHNSKDGKWNVPALVNALTSPVNRKRVIDSLAKLVGDYNWRGVCIDFEEIPDTSQMELLYFMQELHANFNQRGWLVMQAVPFDDPAWNYTALAGFNDYLMLMAYDEHWAESSPGSVCGQNWYLNTLNKRLKEVSPDKTIVCIGGYGYDWSGKGESTELTFQETVLIARDSQAKVEFDTGTLNPYFRYQDEKDAEHEVWFLDAVTAYNQMEVAAAKGVAGFALWRLGSEDPSLWSIYGSDDGKKHAEGLKQIRYGYDVDFEGMGEILDIIALPHDGSRAISFDSSSGLITENHYDDKNYPSSYVIQRIGYKPALIALTFDDGPDRICTPKILDILKRENVKASFFIIGQNGETEPDILKRIVAEGHDIGNHSFTHPNLGEIPSSLTKMELNATKLLIESLTGRSTRLFRAPYFGDAEPTTPDEVEPARIAKELGYIIVGLRVDPDDWALPGATQIVERTVSGITNPDPDQRGQIVLLHDGGGDRSQTVDALPELIRDLRTRGYQFATVTELSGLSRDVTMPPVPNNRTFFARTDEGIFYSVSYLGWLLHWVFVVGIILGLGRMLFIGALALAQRFRARRREVTHAGEAFNPLISVIVPAYNEEKVIARTIESLLASDYSNFEIIVVDDGSPDKTTEVVKNQFGNDPRVQSFRVENGGKAEALNFGLGKCSGEIIIGLDADTIFEKETIGSLAHRFADPQMGAIAGNAKVGNRINLITRWQALEYITSQNLDRRAFSSLNCITVVPGAIGAWRRDLLDETNGFASDTLAEDQDLTLKVRKLGYKIGYEENAIAWTEAPDTVRGLAKQRFRWSFGTLQCMWKHRDALFRPKYGTLGFLAMPNVWIFQILFPLISPVMDLMFIWTLISSVIERLEHPAEYAISNLGQVMFYYALFLAVDWLAALFAFTLERHEQWSLLWWLFLQRFCYRQVMYYVMIKSVLTACRGAVVGWGKLERKATVEMPN
ncbi:MAG: glycosyltransferase [Acidobacteria bacterium]|nr:glycosyltransferase [Acidobacteriota bacterium]